MAKDVPYLMKNINLHIQEVQLVPSRTNKKRSTPRHIIITFLKDKHKQEILKAKEKNDSNIEKNTSKN